MHDADVSVQTHYGVDFEKFTACLNSLFSIRHSEMNIIEWSIMDFFYYLRQFRFFETNDE